MSDALKTVPTMDFLREKRDQILDLAARHGAFNVRVFGSVARGEATPDSDVDLLVEFRDGATLWDAVGLWQSLQELLGREVSLVGDDQRDSRFKQRIRKDAMPLAMLDDLSAEEEGS